MSNTEDDGKIAAVEKIGSGKSKEIQEGIEPLVRVPPDKEQFDNLMNQGVEKGPSSVSQEGPAGVSLMDQVRDINNRVDSVSRASPDTIIAQSGEVIKQIETVKAKLAAPGVEIKGSVQTLLHNKLSHIDESLKVALNRAGIEYAPPPVGTKTTNLAGPIDKFIGMLTHGQYQLQKLSDDVSMMGNSNASFTPANMLAIQIKVGYVQQEVELFTNILNKSLESIKTIMNVQI
jgi:hypothetical protein